MSKMNVKLIIITVSTLISLFLTFYFMSDGDSLSPFMTTDGIESPGSVKDTVDLYQAVDSLLLNYQTGLRKEDTVNGKIFYSAHIRKDTMLMNAIRRNEKLTLHPKSK